MPVLPESFAMDRSGRPDAACSREQSADQLAGPQSGGAHCSHVPAHLAKFHAPEIVFGPGALAELGHCAARLGARRPFLVTDPGLIEAGWVDEGVAHLRRAGFIPASGDDMYAQPKPHYGGA